MLKEFQSLRLRIEGHTDNVGQPAENLKLSEERAEAVKQYLASKGVDPARLEAVGRGDTAPIADNASEKGRALNRRIEFKVVGK